MFLLLGIFSTRYFVFQYTQSFINVSNFPFLDLFIPRASFYCDFHIKIYNFLLIYSRHNNIVLNKPILKYRESSKPKKQLMKIVELILARFCLVLHNSLKFTLCSVEDIFKKKLINVS
jgi:hypothetical protein